MAGVPGATVIREPGLLAGNHRLIAAPDTQPHAGLINILTLLRQAQYTAASLSRDAPHWLLRHTLF